MTSLKMCSSVISRLAALDEELKVKREGASKVTVFQPFLKNPDSKYYMTDLVPDFAASEALLAAMSGVLDQTRTKRFKNTKVSFKMAELESIFKSTYRVLEIWSFVSSSFEVLGDCFLELREKLPKEFKDLAIQHTSLLRCVDKAGRHGIGESVNILANLMLKKREHVMSMAYQSVPNATKCSIIFGPISKIKLLPMDHVRDATRQFRQETQTSALVAVAASAKPSSTKPFFRGTSSSNFYGSPLQDRRGRGGRRGRGNRHKGSFFLRNREYFSKRDRYVRGSQKSYRRPQSQQ